MKVHGVKGYILTGVLLLCAGIMAQASPQHSVEMDSVKMQWPLVPENNRSMLYNHLSKPIRGIDTDSKVGLENRLPKTAEEQNDALQQGYALIKTGNYLLHQGKADSAVALYLKARDAFKEQNHSRGVMHSFNSLGVTYHKYHAYNIARKQFEKAVDLSHKANALPHEKATIFTNLATVLYSKNQPEIAMQYVDSATQALEESRKPVFKATAYANLAMTYTSIDRFKQALTYFQKAGDLLTKRDNEQMKALFWMDLADLYRHIYNYDKALNFYQKALTIQKARGNTHRIASLYNSLGQTQLKRKAYEKAIEQFSRGALYNKKHGDKEGLLRNIQHLSSTLLKKGNPRNARDTLQAYFTQAEAWGDFALLSEFHRLLSTSYKQNNQQNQALEHQTLSRTFADSLHDKQQKDREAFFETKLKLQEHWQSRRINRLQEQIEKPVEGRTVFYLVIAGVALLGGILVFWLVVRYKRMKKDYQGYLQEKVQKLDETQKKLNETSTNIEAKINERTKELQKEIEEYKKKDVDLKKALKDAEEANYLKNAFLSNMSHEIRTPLNGIIGFSSLLETELSLMENKELYEYAQGIQTSGERLLHLLNNIIDISRIEANDLQVSRQDTNVKQIIEKSAELYKFKANEKGLKFNMKLEDTPMVHADPTSLSKVISDVIDNAIKYTEEGFVNITSDYDSERNEVFIKIRDTGVGIDENYLPKVFEAFRQESLGYSRAYQGAGLGLPLAKRLLQLMDGNIKIDSKKNEGTNVFITLPTKEKAMNKVSHQRDSSSGEKTQQKLIKPASEINILLVEDDRMNRLVINKMLENDWNVVAVEDGDQTLEEVNKTYKNGKIFDLMLFDINLPNPWDGIQLMQHLRKKYPEYKEVPFIAQTAYAMHTDRRRLLEEGFDEYISKPINQQRLLTMVYNFLSRK